MAAIDRNRRRKFIEGLVCWHCKTYVYVGADGRIFHVKNRSRLCDNTSPLGLRVMVRTPRGQALDDGP